MKVGVLVVLLFVMVIGLAVKACQPALSHGAQCQEWAHQHNWEAFDDHRC